MKKCKHCWIKTDLRGVFDIPILCQHGEIVRWEESIILKKMKCHLCGKERWAYAIITNTFGEPVFIDSKAEALIRSSSKEMWS